MSKPKILKISVIIIIWVGIPILFGFLSLSLGKDINWDLRNYHFYNGYAFIENRLGFDVAPAQVQTYFNPLLDVPIYLLYKSFPTKIIGFLYGFLQGYNISFILLIFFSTSAIISTKIKLLLGFVIAIVASIAPGFISELGSSMTDNVVSLFILLSILLLIYSMSAKKKIWQYLLIGIAGLLMGLIVGLKFTAAIFAVTMGISLPILVKSNAERIKTFGLFVVTGFLGFISTNGFWMITLWKDFKSVLFPFYNNIFHSPFMVSQAFLDQRFLPRNLLEYLFWPFIFSINSHRVSELKFSDIRFAILYVLFILWGVSIVIRKFTTVSKKQPKQSNQLLSNKTIGNFILVFLAISYILWLFQFSIYRYIRSLELLVPLCAFLILDRIFSNKKNAYLSLFFLIVLGAIYFTPANWIRLPWSDPYVQVNTGQFPTVTNGVIVMLGTSPTSYVIPYFPKDIQFIRPQSNFTDYYGPSLKEQITESISTTKYPIYILYDKNDTSVDLNRSALDLGINIMQGTCKEVQDNMPEALVLCEATRKTLAYHHVMPQSLTFGY